MATGSILLIDDDAALLRFVARVLSGEGYVVSLADSAKAGIERYRAEAADLVITDLVMPDAGGIETIRALRQVNPSVKIIAMSGESVAFLEVAQRLGASGILEKPFSSERLLEAVADVLA